MPNGQVDHIVDLQWIAHASLSNAASCHFVLAAAMAHTAGKAGACGPRVPSSLRQRRQGVQLVVAVQAEVEANLPPDQQLVCKQNKHGPMRLRTKGAWNGCSR